MSISESRTSDPRFSVGIKTVIATACVEGFHCWLEAPKVVGYLANKHRHLFTLRGEWSVGHSNRQVEFHIARRWLLDAAKRVRGGGLDFGRRSCEQIAIEMNQALVALDLPPCAAIEVWEDGEHGARVQFSVY